MNVLPTKTDPLAKPADVSELLECMRKIGKFLIASGTSVGVVENILTRIAMAYHVPCEVVALPNILMVKLGQGVHELTDFSVQRAATLPFHQISAMSELVDDVLKRKTSLAETSKQVDRILAMPPRFNSVAVLLGYVVSIIGLTMLFRPDLEAILVTGIAGVLVGLLILLFNKWPRFDLLLPILAAIIVSVFVFGLTKRGMVFGPSTLIVPPLVIFLPGATLTTSMIELASRHLISGSSRLIYGAATLFLLFIGIGIGLELTNVPEALVYTYEASVFPWWAPILGTLLFGAGTFIRLSGANRDFFWMLLVLYIAMAGQTFGERLFNPYIGAFLGAMLMALSSELIARSPRRTPALVSQALAFWFLVPGARGLLSVTRILSDDFQSAMIGVGEMLILITAITLGVFVGTLVVAANKFATVTIDSEEAQK
jgi:uncharacterized membrane protein YjjP (DUF1212 family)